MKQAGFFLMLTVGTATASVTAASAQDSAAGQNVFSKCIACHAVGEGAVNKVGPALNGLEGRKAGTYEKYSYSEANKKSGIVWTEAEFKDYIKAPKSKIPNTKMAFAGLSSDKEAGDLWAYLVQFKPDGTKK